MGARVGAWNGRGEVLLRLPCGTGSAAPEAGAPEWVGRGHLSHSSSACSIFNLSVCGLAHHMNSSLLLVPVPWILLRCN